MFTDEDREFEALLRRLNRLHRRTLAARVTQAGIIVSRADIRRVAIHEIRRQPFFRGRTQ